MTSNENRNENPSDNDALARLRAALAGTPYENQVWLVGGYVRDKLMGRAVDGAILDDIDLVLEGDASKLAWTLFNAGCADHAPVEFPTFGTAMLHVGGSQKEGGAQVELVTARAETYRQGSRRPIVTPGTLETDALRRDFTVNTFLENLHTGEVRDPTGQGRADLDARLLRTPLDPNVTFTDDPLRALRACRFAAKLGFDVEAETFRALSANAFRCGPEYGISFERIRDELVKTLVAPGTSRGLEMMRETGLLARFAPELSDLHGVRQNRYHRYDVWEHTLVALGNLPTDAPLLVRLATLLHDVGKPPTRTVDDTTGDVHFYEHEKVGASMARGIMTRLKFSADEIKAVSEMVGLHMRYGAYEPDVWTNASVRRLIRAVGPYRRDLFVLARADISACNTDDFPAADLDGLSERMETIEAASHITTATSPLFGEEIIARLGIRPGPLIGKIKNVLTDAVVAGELDPDDKDGAEAMARRMLAEND